MLTSVDMRIVAVLAGVLVPPQLVASQAHAAPPECVDPASGPVEATPEYTTAQKLFDRGVVHYDSGDFRAAITLWQEAAGVLPREAGYRVIKAELVYNVAQALDKWFEVDRDIEHLRQAKISLENFARESLEVYTAGEAAAEQGKTRRKIEELEAKIVAAETAERARQMALAEAGRADLNPELIERERRRNRAMIGAGAGLVTLGAAGLGVMGAGVVIGNDAQNRVGELPGLDQASRREEEIERGNRANGLAVAGAVIGGVSLLAGVPLLITGAVFERRLAENEADAGLTRVKIDGISPAYGMRHAGVVLRGRF